MTDTGLTSISIVSHLQHGLVLQLLRDIQNYCASPVEVILTINVPEEEQWELAVYRFPVTIVRNERPKGFGSNHNAAFRISKGDFFCVMNPDIRFDNDPFPALQSCLSETGAGVAAPVVLGADGSMEDSARRFPTPLRILCKAIGGCKREDYMPKDEVVFPDWVAGMFMLFRRESFDSRGGFDERYFLYYEDVDLCARMRLQGLKVVLCPFATVVHHAQRSSHRDLRYLKLHLTSMLRFFLTPPWWTIFWLRLTGKFL